MWFKKEKLSEMKSSAEQRSVVLSTEGITFVSLLSYQLYFTQIY